MSRFISKTIWRVGKVLSDRNRPLRTAVIDGMAIFVVSLLLQLLLATAESLLAPSGQPDPGDTRQMVALSVTAGLMALMAGWLHNRYLQKHPYLVWSPSRALWSTTAVAVGVPVLWWLGLGMFFGASFSVDVWLFCLSVFGPGFAGFGYRRLAYVDRRSVFEISGVEYYHESPQETPVYVIPRARHHAEHYVGKEVVSVPILRRMEE